MTATNEKWFPVAGFEDFYQISNMGRVKSNDRIIVRRNGPYLKKGRTLKSVPNIAGYMRVTLKGCNTEKRFFVHRLVASAFVENPLGKPHVNHMDSNFLNNRAENLEWVTHKENIHHAMRSGRFDRSFAMTPQKFHKSIADKALPVIGTHVKTGEVIVFQSINEAGRYFGNAASGICVCCQGKLQTSHSYRWKYLSDYKKAAGGN